ncbi:lactonase family protein [Streptomyces armeniacus]|uniref:Lactonase family protein n=1 Tax=Streptomyces armeniacus TaxID=83291 RepID=A0A345XK12_9ACTN|nr:lactonase family protein [Streptomyces armeniacus]AXK31978.1 lactonase family protein [Streptomyces armeniacus]
MTTDSTARRSTEPAPADRAYIGSFTSSGGRGITTAVIDTTDGALRPVHHTDRALPDPSYLLARPGLLYAVCETEQGTAAALSLADRDRPVPLGEPVPVRGAAPTHLTLAAGRLFTANYTSGSVSALPMRADGTLGGQPSVHPHHGGGPHPDRQRGPHTHAVVAAPSGRWLLAVDLGTDSVWIYALDGPDSVERGDEVRPHGEVRLRAGSGPRQIAFHPGGAYAYVTGELDPAVTLCRWDDTTGTLEPLAETPLLPAGATGESYPSELVVRQDGRFAWAAVRGQDAIAVLALGGDGGTVEPAGTVPCGGHWPRGLALHPGGQWLYAANERSGDVTWFTLDDRTGMPRRGGSVEAPAASCVVFG